jgi:large subunit ribosomal protein L25
MLTLDINIRDTDANLSDLRKAGNMPAVFYGKGVPSTPISVAQKDFLKVWREAGESSVITLKDATATVDTLIHAVDVDPVTDIPRHADFYVFEKGKKLEVSVPLEFVGVAPVVKDLGGSLVKALHDLKISAEPQNLPHSIEVDISSLVDFDSQILAGDLKLPANVDLVELPTEVVASGARPKEEEVEEAPVDLSAIEVEKKGKKEEEGAEAAPAPESAQ